MIAGVRLATIAAGIKKNGREDLVLFALGEQANAAAVFTQSAFCAAPVTLGRAHLAYTTNIRALLINSGNANAGTGESGIETARAHCAAVAARLGAGGAPITSEQVLPFSTGVIGEPLPHETMLRGIAMAADQLPSGDATDADWQQAAHGIMTTDTQPKMATRAVALDTTGESITLTGIAKGAGMIEPHMATMLAFVCTDATIEPEPLEDALHQAVAGSFNSITVDSDTSTNDSLVLAATGAGPALKPVSPGWAAFQGSLNELCLELAQAIVRDAEGATKFITVEVIRAQDERMARRVAYAVANSPLVKTACFASDANVGRLLMAIGKADVPMNPLEVRVFLGDLPVFENGRMAENYTEAAGSALMRGTDLHFRIDLAHGKANTRVYTSDLSHDYVSINADYRS